MRRKLKDIRNAAIRKLTELTGDSTIVRTFDFMQIAGEEIDRGKLAAESDAAAKRAHRCFMACQPGGFVHFTDVVYRAHVRELVQRALDDESLVPATKAEVMLVLSQGSLTAPLNAQHTALYEELFKDIFGHYVRPDDVTREPYAGATAELLHTLRQKCRKEERKLA